MNSSKESEKWISDMVGTFTDPVIVFPAGGWENDIPVRIKEQLTLERLLMCMRAAKGEEPTATDAEALAYLYPRTMLAPLGRDWTDIYLYLGTKVMGRAGTEFPDDIRKDTLPDDLMKDLDRLKAWIYQKRIAARLARDRGERRQAKEEKAEQKKQEQPAMFDFAAFDK